MLFISFVGDSGRLKDINIMEGTPVLLKDELYWIQSLILRNKHIGSGVQWDQQVKKLLYCVGQEAKDLLTSLGCPKKKKND